MAPQTTRVGGGNIYVTVFRRRAYAVTKPSFLPPLFFLLPHRDRGQAGVGFLGVFFGTWENQILDSMKSWEVSDPHRGLEMASLMLQENSKVIFTNEAF